MFFVLIALTSDMICFLFIPVHWLFFAASTYVWVQYVWHTERGICLPTVSLWLLFVYIEASVRLKELKTPSSSHHLDLCRPFAAHCIGYPVVTLGFGVKSYLSYRMRLRKQREVAKVNDFYVELVQKALPDEVVQAQKQQQQQSLLTKQQLQQQEAVADTMVTEKVTLNGSPVSNGHVANGHHHHPNSHTPSSNNSRKQVVNGGVSSSEKVSSSSSSSSSSTITNLITPNNHHQSRQHEHQCLYLLPWQNRRSESSKSSQQQQQHQQNSSEYDAKPRSSTVSSTSSEKTSASSPDKHNHQNSTTNELHNFDRQYMEQKIISSISSSQKPSSKSLLSTVNDFDEDADFDVGKTSFKHSITASLNSCPGSGSNSLNTSCSSTPSKWSNQSNILNSTNSSSSSGGSSSGKKNKPDKNHVVNNLRDQSSVSSPTSSPVTNGGVLKDSAGDLVASNHLQRLEADIKRLKADLQASRQTEQDLRVQVASLLKGKLEEDKLRAELEQFQADNETLQTKLQNLTTARQQDKANISLLEKKVQDEKKLKANLETQLNNERESKKKKDQADQAKLQQQAAAAAARTAECTESCKTKRREMENDIKTIRRDLKLREDQLKQLERETHSLRAYKDSHGDTEILMSALSAMQEKNAHLEGSLSAETRLKLDLFSALGDTKRQLEISQALMAQKDKEIDELKSKIAEVMACMPSSVHPSLSSNPFSLDNSIVSSILFNSKFLHDSSASSASAAGSSSTSGREVPNDLQ